MLTDAMDSLEDLQSKAEVKGLLRPLEVLREIVELLLVIAPSEITYRHSWDAYRYRRSCYTYRISLEMSFHAGTHKSRR